MKPRLFYLLLLTYLVAVFEPTTAAEAECNRDDGFCQGSAQQYDVKVSAECAATLLVAGGAIGGAVTPYLTPQLLAMLGFSSTGVAAGSFASWWQSTMPLIAKGSLFATLQSCAMRGAGHYSSIAIGSALGGGVSAKWLNAFCSSIDDSVKSNSNVGKIVAGNLALVENTREVTRWTKEKAASVWDWTQESMRELAANHENIAILLDNTGEVVKWTTEKAETAWDWTLENTRELADDENIARFKESTVEAASWTKDQAESAVSWILGKAREKTQQWASDE